jgi:hypothetical protein
MAEAAKRLVLGRPVDKSFESYKAWITGMYAALTGKPADEMDEAETEKMRAGWRAFWAGTEQAEAPVPPEKP